MSHSAAWHPNYHSAYIPSGRSLAVPKFSRLVDDLVKRGEDIVCELDLRNRLHSLCRSTDRKSHNPLFCQRCIEDSLRPELGLQVHGAPEDSAKGNVFAEEHDLAGFRQCGSQSRIYGLV